MTTWEKIKLWMGKTLNMSYFKKLIDSDTNDDLKDFGAMVFYWISGLICLAAAAVFLSKEEYTNTLYLISAIFGFICALLGIKEAKNAQKTYSDNKTKREMGKTTPDDKKDS